MNGNMKNGKYCMTLISQHIKTMPSTISMEEFCRDITAVIHCIYADKGIDLQRLISHPTERLTASAIIYSLYKNEIWMIGDCQCLVNHIYYNNPKPYEDIIAQKRSLYIHTALSQGESITKYMQHDYGRDSIIDELINTCKFQNNTYAVIDGFTIPINKVKKIRLNDRDAEIVLASDGYPFLRNTLSKSETELAMLLSIDPLCINKHKATKGVMAGNISFDDRAYVRFHL